MAEPNQRLRAARERLPSRRTPGACLGRQELAELINEWVYTHRGETRSLDKNYIGKLEQGRIHWPDEPYRAALRAILSAANDAQLGFYDTRRMPIHTTAEERHRFLQEAARHQQSAFLPADWGAMARASLTADAQPDTTSTRQTGSTLSRVPQPRYPPRTAAALTVSWLPTDGIQPRHDQPPRAGNDGVPRQIVELADEVKHAIEQPRDDGSPYHDRLERLQQDVHQHAAAVATTPPAEMIGRLTPDLIDAHRMLRYAQTDTDTVLLRTMLARLSAIVADELSVLGSVGPARAWHTTATTAADRTGSRSVRAEVRAFGAMLPLYHGRQVEAIQLAQQAQQLAGPTPRFATTLASMLEAIARARLGDHERARTALRKAKTTYDKMDDTETAESFFGFSIRRRLFYEGRLLTMVGDYAAAESAHQQARELYPPHVVGDPAVMNLDRATALISLNDVEAGAKLITATLLNLPADHQTGIFLTLATRAFDTIPVPARRLPASRECAELLDSMLSIQ